MCVGSLDKHPAVIGIKFKMSVIMRLKNACHFKMISIFLVNIRFLKFNYRDHFEMIWDSKYALLSSCLFVGSTCLPQHLL